MCAFPLQWGHVNRVAKISEHNFEAGWGSQPPEKRVVDYSSKPAGIFYDFSAFGSHDSIIPPFHHSAIPWNSPFVISMNRRQFHQDYW
jgi:hypothetical protein